MAIDVTKAVAKWVEESALDPHEPEFSLPPALLGQIDGSRVIFLGECSHFTHEKSDFRLWWIDQLSRRWPIRLGEELGRSDGMRVNRYLSSGDEKLLEQVPTFGFKGDDRTDRDDIPTGVLRASHETYPTALFKAEQSRFYRGVRQLDRDITLFGFDINGSLGSPYVDIRRRLVGASRNAARDKFLAALEQVSGESMEEELVRLENAGDLLREVEGGDVVREAAFDLLVAIHTLQFAIDAYPATEYAELNPAMSQREELMKQQVRWALAKLAPNEKLVLMAHAFHLARDDGGILSPRGGAGPGGESGFSLGHHLAQEMGEGAFSVWMVHGSGDDSQPFPDLSNHFDYPENSLNALLLGSSDEEVVLPVAALEAEIVRLPVGHMYNSVSEVDLRAEADAIHFFPRVSPLRGE